MSAFTIFVLLLCLSVACFHPVFAARGSIIGDPLMQNADVHVMWEGWNFCNQAGNISVTAENSFLSSWYDPHIAPRYADCSRQSKPLVTLSDNLLSYPDPIPASPSPLLHDLNWYAQEKARYLGRLCQQLSGWSWWTLMVKNGNLDLNAQQCPETRLKEEDHQQQPEDIQIGTARLAAPSKVMNQPLVYQHFTAVHPTNKQLLAGAFLGTFTMSDPALQQVENCIAAADFPSKCHSLNNSLSFFSTVFTKDLSNTSSSWLFKHQLVTDESYEWLMLYQRSDASSYYNGGYDWTAPGMMLVKELSSDAYPHFYLHVFFNVTRSDSLRVQFYLPEVGGCWKADGSSCDGDHSTDITRYVNFMVNPNLEGKQSCSANSLSHCPPVSKTQLRHKNYPIC